MKRRRRTWLAVLWVVAGSVLLAAAALAAPITINNFDPFTIDLGAREFKVMKSEDGTYWLAQTAAIRLDFENKTGQVIKDLDLYGVRIIENGTDLGNGVFYGIALWSDFFGTVNLQDLNRKLHLDNGNIAADGTFFGVTGIELSPVNTTTDFTAKVTLTARASTDATPIPEPGTLSLLGLALVSLAGWRRRQACR